MLQAVAAVKTKRLTIRAASLQYGVPMTTIADRTSGRYIAAPLQPG